MEQIIIGLIIICALFYLGSRLMKSFKKNKNGGCSGGCGCPIDQPKDYHVK